MPVAVVTDSTAYLPAELSGTYDLTVVPLTVVVNGDEGLEGSEITPAEVARALSAHSSSRPTGSFSTAAPTASSPSTCRRGSPAPTTPRRSPPRRSARR